MEQDWLQKTLKEIDIQSGNLSKHDYRFFQIDRLKRIAERTDEFEAVCKECSDNKAIITNISKDLYHKINAGAKAKRELEKKQEDLMKHFQKAHKIFSINYFVSYYSFFGLVAGILSGLLPALFFQDILIALLIAGSIVGLISGYIIGNRKDKKARLENRLI